MPHPLLVALLHLTLLLICTDAVLWYCANKIYFCEFLKPIKYSSKDMVAFCVGVCVVSTVAVLEKP